MLGLTKAEQVERDFSNLRSQIELRKIAANASAEINTTYYSVLIFQSTEQLEAFVKALQLRPDDENPRFLSGTELARKLGITLPPAPAWKDLKVKQLFAELAEYLPREK